MFYPQIFNPVFEETSKLLTHPRMFVTITGLFQQQRRKREEAIILTIHIFLTSQAVIV